MATVFDVTSYGAVGNGTTDDTSAIQSAMNATIAAKGILYFPPGLTFLLSAEITGGSNVTVDGYGATLKSATRFRSYLGFLNCSTYSVSGLTFDLAQPVLPLYTAADYAAPAYAGSVYNVGIYNDGSANFELAFNTFNNLYTVGIQLFHCSGRVLLFHNRHTSPVQLQEINLQHIQVNSSGVDLVIDSCWFDNAAPASADVGVAGVYASGVTGSVRCVNSYFNYCGRNSVGTHQLGAFSSYGDVTNIVVDNCLFLNCLQQVVRLSSCWYAEVRGCFMSMAQVAGSGDQMISVEATIAFAPGIVGVNDIKIHHNTLIDNFNASRYGIVVESTDWAATSQDVDIHDNAFVNMQYALSATGPYNNLRFQHNQIRGNHGGVVTVTQNASIAGITGSEAQSGFYDLHITDNVFDLSTNGAITIFVDFIKSPVYSGTIGAIDISRNSLRQDAIGAGSGIAGRGVAGAPIGSVRVVDNRITRYTNAIDIANFGELILENTIASACTTFQQNAGTNTLEILHGNRMTVGKTQGRATLVAGTATVSTAEVVASDNILLSRVVSSGATGQLSVGTITAGTSFTITSSSTSDTSTVYWVIDH